MTETKDFYSDTKRRRRMVRNTAIFVGVGVALGAAAVGLMERKNRDDVLAQSTAAAGPAVKGPPCPTATAETFAPQAAKATKLFQFNGDTYARRFGHLDCNLVEMKGVRDPVAVCQFTGPRALSVTTAKGTSYFLPGAGQPATITVIDEVPSCVLASNFR